jgi:hypothetical protein
MRTGKVIYYLARYIFDTFDCNPLSAFVTFPLFDEVLFRLTRVGTRDNTKGCRWGERATSGGRNTFRETLAIWSKNEGKRTTMGVLHVITDRKKNMRNPTKRTEEEKLYINLR